MSRSDILRSCAIRLALWPGPSVWVNHANKQNKYFDIRCSFELSWFYLEIINIQQEKHKKVQGCLRRVAVAASPEGLEVPHGFQESQIVLLAPYTNRTNQGRIDKPSYPATRSSLTFGQWRAEGGGRTGRRPRASKAGGHPKSEITNVKML